jgi:NAD(P)-dependent dehydrogenase (short-subunit alcohol dehydrogenase family)
MNMKDKVVLITGASRGIGAASARVFASLGAKVALVARTTDQIETLAADIGQNAIAISCDVSLYDDVVAAIAKTEETFGPLDVLIGNAGSLDPISHLADADPEIWGKTIDVNLKGVFNGMRAAMPDMIKRGKGTIITVSSGAAHGPVEAWSSYCASKAGAYMMTRCADLEAREKGLRIMGLSPGTVATDMQREIKASGINPVSKLEWSDHIPPEWPARTLVWMCSTDADEFCGTDISLRESDIRKRVGLI